MKKLKIIPIIIFIGGFICGLTYITYAGIYNSEEISYDNSISHADAENVKDAIDWLYTNAGMKNECPEDMTCIESPVVTINSSGPGSVDKESMHVRIGGTNKFIVIPNDDFSLKSITCTDGYELSDFYTLSNEAKKTQEIIITNLNVNKSGTCDVEFSTSEIYIGQSPYQDKCYSPNDNCICALIHTYVTGWGESDKRGQSFNYAEHTGCKFTRYDCISSSGTWHPDCSTLRFNELWWTCGPGECRYEVRTDSGISMRCSGYISCET